MSDCLSHECAPPRFFSADTWLSEIMECPVYKWTGHFPEMSGGMLSAEMSELANGGDAFFFAKISTSEIAQCNDLARAGFTVVDTGITFSWSGNSAKPAQGMTVGIAHSAQHEAVAEIAEHCFRWSRFHLDPKISSKLANLIKRRWVENYCLNKRGSALYACEVDGSTAGFLGVIETILNNQSVAYIDLVGVAPAFQGRGVGTALVQHFIKEWRGRATELRVATQAANIRSMRVYENNGFRAVESSYVLHAHYRNGVINL